MKMDELGLGNLHATTDTCWSLSGIPAWHLFAAKQGAKNGLLPSWYLVHQQQQFPQMVDSPSGGISTQSPLMIVYFYYLWSKGDHEHRHGTKMMLYNQKYQTCLSPDSRPFGGKLPVKNTKKEWFHMAEVQFSAWVPVNHSTFGPIWSAGLNKSNTSTSIGILIPCVKMDKSIYIYIHTHIHIYIIYIYT